jgi:hypothetical protein
VAWGRWRSRCPPPGCTAKPPGLRKAASEPVLGPLPATRFGKTPAARTVAPARWPAEPRWPGWPPEPQPPPGPQPAERRGWRTRSRRSRSRRDRTRRRAPCPNLPAHRRPPRHLPSAAEGFQAEPGFSRRPRGMPEPRAGRRSLAMPWARPPRPT